METTLNIHVEILAQIKRAALINGIACSEMIDLLIQKVAGNIADPTRIGRMVKYQKRCPPQEWHVIHVKIKEDMYEYWLDLRKLLKMSVSLILAYAVKKFISKIFNKMSADNYRCENYIIIKEVVENIIVWKFIWGYPPNLEKILNFEENN